MLSSIIQKKNFCEQMSKRLTMITTTSLTTWVSVGAEAAQHQIGMITTKLNVYSHGKISDKDYLPT